MKIDRIYTRNALATTCGTPLAEAAAAMRRHRVGTLLVIEDDSPSGRTVGIVTDRDIALQGFARADARVESVMTPVVATVHHDADTHEALEIMRAHGVRRLVVTDVRGAVRGILSIDDVVDGLSREMAAAAAVLMGDVRRDSAGLGEVRTGAATA